MNVFASSFSKWFARKNKLVEFSTPNRQGYSEFYSIYYSDPVKSQGGTYGSWSATFSSLNGRVYDESYPTCYSDPVGSQGGVYAVRKRD